MEVTQEVKQIQIADNEKYQSDWQYCYVCKHMTLFKHVVFTSAYRAYVCFDCGVD